MSQRLIVTVLMRGDEIIPSGTRGFGYVDEIFSEAGLRGDLDDQVTSNFWQRVRILGRALTKEFDNRVILHVLSPWSVRGLWFVVRTRVRHFPALVIDGQAFPLETPIDELIEIIHNILS